MPVNAHIELPTDVNPDHVARAVGVMAGCPAALRPLDDHGGLTLDVAGVNVKATSVEGMTDVIIGTPDGAQRGATFHYCTRGAGDTGPAVFNLLYPRSTPFWCAAGRRLVAFFGGRIVFSDAAEETGANVHCGRERTCPVDRYGLIPGDGAEWDDFWRAVAAIKPLTKAELKAARAVAAYKESE